MTRGTLPAHLEHSAARGGLGRDLVGRQWITFLAVSRVSDKSLLNCNHARHGFHKNV